MAVVPRRSLIGRSGANSRSGGRASSGADTSWADTSSADTPDDQTTEPPIPSQTLAGFGDLGDLEVVERPVPGGGFSADETYGHDSFAMEDVSEEVRRDPRLNQRAEPATELIDRDAFAALVAAEDDEVITVGPHLDSEGTHTGEITPQSIPTDADDAPDVVPTARHTTSGLHTPDPETQFLQGAFADPRTEVIQRDDVSEDALAEATVRTPLPTLAELAELEQLDLPPHHPVDFGHDELWLPPSGGGFAVDPERSSSRDTGDALALPPPEPGEESAPIDLERFSPSQRARMLDHTLPIQVPPIQAPPSEVPPGEVPPGEVPPSEVPPSEVPLGQVPLGQVPSQAPGPREGEADTRALTAPSPGWAPEAEARAAVSPEGPLHRGLTREPTDVPGVPPMVGLLALIGSGGLLAAVVAGSLALLVAAAVFVVWDGAEPSTEMPLPPIELPAPEPVLSEPPEPAPSEPSEPSEPVLSEPSGSDRSPAREGGRGRGAPVPDEPEDVIEPVPVDPAPEPPAPPVDLPDDLEPEDDDKKRGLFRRKKEDK